MLLSHRLARALPRELPRALARRDITIGRDGANHGAMFCIMMVPQAEEWMIERFGKFAYIAHTMGVCLASLSPLSSWVGIQLGYIAGAYAQLGGEAALGPVDPFLAFLTTVPGRASDQPASC